MPRLAYVHHRLPVQKIYFNWKSGKSEKCIFCYPRIEAGMPTVCSESCVGRIRYLGVLLHDADAIENAASTENEKDLYQRQLDVFPRSETIRRLLSRLKDGIPQSVIDAGAAVSGVQNGDGLEAGPAAAPGIPHAADGLVRAAVSDSVCGGCG